MTGVLTALQEAASGAAALGMAQALAGRRSVRRFAAAPRPEPAELPPVTVLKPLHGDEPLLEEALASVCMQDYPEFQVVFGVQDAADPARAVAERLRRRFPERDIRIVADSAGHGRNRKVGNLINMHPHAMHDVIVIADSDLHVRPDYLRRLVAALQAPGIGLVTTLYRGLPSSPGPFGALGATQIDHGFLPGAVLARALGRQDCLGGTMALRRETLERIGGLRALADHLADDNVLGRLVRAEGLGVGLAATVPLTTVPETGLAALFSHELRWARTIRALAPVGFALSSVQHPIAWAAAAFALAPSAWTAVLFAAAWAVRALAARGVDRALAPLLGGGALAKPAPVWLLPLRDALSAAVMLASYAGTQVRWRGHAMHADGPIPAPMPLPMPMPMPMPRAGAMLAPIPTPIPTYAPEGVLR